jgi:tRNA G10  N-methylase Trm11
MGARSFFAVGSWYFGSNTRKADRFTDKRKPFFKRVTSCMFRLSRLNVKARLSLGYWEDIVIC